MNNINKKLLNLIQSEFPLISKPYVGLGQNLDITEDEVPEPPDDPITKTGDLWILGEHKLLCGDSTNEAVVSRLMGKERASLFATDPPYCIDYTGTDRPGGGKDWSDTFHDGKSEVIKKFWKQFLIVGLKYIKKNTAIYLWHADGKRSDIGQESRS